MGQNNKSHHHHILPTKVALTIGGLLLVLTVVTVGIAHVDLGRFNFAIAMAVATVKALLVALFFMGLKYERNENAMIFGTSFLFLGIFIVLASVDLFFRGDVYVKGPLMAAQSGPSKLKNPWISTPELVAKGKSLYSIQCASCHGVEGKGDGPASSALTPHPRNFHAAEGWKNGRKPTMVFKTLKEGLPPSSMASYATLPSDDRWALTHYVLSLGDKPGEDTPADFTKAGVDPSGAAEKVDATVPIYVALERMTVPSVADARSYHSEPYDAEAEAAPAANEPPAKRMYQAHCVQCHGVTGKGGIKVKNLGLYPVAYVTTAGFNLQSEGLQSQEKFNERVIRGIPGDLMPGMGHLSGAELRDLYQFVRGLASSR